jgi:hypothetical protein
MNFSYQVGREKYFNKLQAIQQNLKTGEPIKLSTPYGVDSDFSIEPEATLQTLMKDRLIELRDSYKKIKLYYSGGSDSHLILENVISNDIHIDEIVCLKSGIPTADYEIENYADPVLKRHKDKLRGTTISIKTLTLDDYRNYFKQGVTQEKIRSGAAGTHNYIRLHWPLDMYGQEPNDGVLQIRGMEKPKIIKHGDDYYTYFLDGDLEPHTNNHQFFSIDKKIQCKQSHMFLNTYKTLEVKNESDIWNEEKAWNESIGRNIRAQILPSKNVFFGATDNHIVHKGLKLYYHNRKEQMALTWCQENCPDLLQSWYENVEQLKDITNNKWWNDGHPEMGSVGVFTDFYCLTRNDTKTVDQLFPDGFKP